MKLQRYLRNSEYEYVLHHLQQHCCCDIPLRDLISYNTEETTYLSQEGNKLQIEASNGAIDLNARRDDIPLLFPTPNGADLIKAAFYVLSGYRECVDSDFDQYGRRKYQNSIQALTNSPTRPVVNYYFEWLLEVIEKHCKVTNIYFKKQKVLQRTSLHLTHDIDSARYYNPKRCFFRVAQTLRLRPLDSTWRRIATAAFRSMVHLAGLGYKDNPFWSFESIMNTEDYFGYKSSWFFLPKDNGPFPPDYNLSDDDISRMMRRLIDKGNTVGLHAPINCQTAEQYAAYLRQIQSIVPEAKPVCRQHFLAVDQVRSLRAMQEAGIQYDCSLGFSLSEGFRNGYCLPFHPYDHERAQMMQITEIPLTLMDVTVLKHKGMSYDQILESASAMLDEVRRFTGVFSLLWHNSTFDELYDPGITAFYEQLHLAFSNYSLVPYNYNL